MSKFGEPWLFRGKSDSWHSKPDDGSAYTLGKTVAYVGNPDGDGCELCENIEGAIDRIAVCVNALSGIEDPAAELERLREIERAAGWAHRFLSREATNPDDGEQWEAIEEALRAALDKGDK